MLKLDMPPDDLQQHGLIGLLAIFRLVINIPLSWDSVMLFNGLGRYNPG